MVVKVNILVDKGFRNVKGVNFLSVDALDFEDAPLATLLPTPSL